MRRSKLYIQLIFALFLPICGVGQIDNHFTKEWSATNKLGYIDFIGNIKASSNLSSYLSAGIISYVNYSTKDSIEYKVVTQMDKYSSWVKMTDTSRSDLHYEQDLFDIMEVHARELRRALFNTPMSYDDTVWVTLDEKYGNKAVEVEWNDYAMAISNGDIDEEEQKEYEIKIRQEVDSLDAYKNPIVRIKYKK